MMAPQERGISWSGTEHVAKFMSGLCALALPTWSEIAVAAPGELDAAVERAFTSAVNEPSLAFAVWSARDDVATVLCRFESTEGRIYVSRRGSRTHLRVVTERAALAVLVHDDLEQADFTVCYGGFERAIPFASL